MFLSGASWPNINASSPIGTSKRELWGIKSDYSAPQCLKGQYAIPFFLTERPELCLLAQPSFSPSLRTGFEDCFAWWILWVSRWSEGMTLRLHGCKLRSVHSSSNYTWLIYGIICPICRRMSNFQSNDHLTIQRSNALYCQMKYGLMLDIQRRMKQIIQ